MGLVFYNIFLALYSAGAQVAALWNKKAALWVSGRKAQSIFSTPGLADAPTVWMHCASLGEFEQGRPLLEAIKSSYPNSRIVLTFFSPSGYEIRKNYSGADKILYLPIDGAGNAEKFIDAINPELVLWVKYEYWYYYLSALGKRQIPVLLVSGIFRPSQPFFRWYGGFWQKILGSFAHLFVQNIESQKLLASINITSNVTVTGDTRFDRVLSIADQHTPLPQQLQAFCGNHTVIVAGSTWEEDEEVLMHYTRTYPHIKFIIAPHEVSEARLKDIKAEFPQALLYSELMSQPTVEEAVNNVLIVDNIGNLARLYKYATIAYVGGGFNQSGIHNILEAAVYGRPVIVGPVYEKFAEAIDLVEAGGAFSIENALELEDLLNSLLKNEQELTKASRIAGDYVRSHKGATDMIMQHIYTNRLLMS